jgi:putative FmdB family regulatory protein
MPIYEYQCAACGRVVEKWQKISEEPLNTCPACGGGLSKLISNCSFHLKGSGWYVTDYSGSHSGAAPSPASEGATSADSAATPKAAESKTETIAPAKKFK